eukprot:2124329-Prymnesium_polylepis.1
MPPQAQARPAAASVQHLAKKHAPRINIFTADADTILRAMRARTVAGRFTRTAVVPRDSQKGRAPRGYHLEVDCIRLEREALPKAATGAAAQERVRPPTSHAFLPRMRLSSGAHGDPSAATSRTTGAQRAGRTDCFAVRTA